MYINYSAIHLMSGSRGVPDKTVHKEMQTSDVMIGRCEKPASFKEKLGRGSHDRIEQVC